MQAADGSITRALPPRTPLSHPHGNITNAGAIGTTADLLLGTGTAGAIETRTASQVRTLLGLATTDSPTFSGLTVGQGSSSATAITSGTPNTGIWFQGGNNFSWVTAGIERIRLGSGGRVSATDGISLGGSAGTPHVTLLGDAANTSHQRNGTNGQIARWAKTWTSATNNEVFELDCAGNATTFDLAVCTGSVNATQRGLRIGQKFAGDAVLTPWMELAANSWTCPTTLTIAADQSSGSATLNLRAGRMGNLSGTQTINLLINSASRISANNFGVSIIGGSNGISLTGNVFASADFTLTPSSSRTLTTNGQFTIEMTSNTAGNLVYRGSDGTTRRMALTFV